MIMTFRCQRTAKRSMRLISSSSLFNVSSFMDSP
jgi:hypothetical protein